MEVARVLLEPVIGSHVHSAAKPPYRLALRLGREQESYVHVNGRDKGIARVQYKRYAHGFESAADQLGPRGTRGGRQPLPVYPGEIHAAALEYAPILDDAALTAAAFVPLPGIAAEAASFDALQLRDEAVLQAEKIVCYGVWIHECQASFFGSSGTRVGDFGHFRALAACKSGS